MKSYADETSIKHTIEVVMEELREAIMSESNKIRNEMNLLKIQLQDAVDTEDWHTAYQLSTKLFLLKEKLIKEERGACAV